MKMQKSYAKIVSLLLLMLVLLPPLALAYNIGNYRFNPDASMYDSAEAYLLHLRNYTHRAMVGIRISMGVAELKAGATRWVCTGFCILGGPGYSISPHSGETALIEVGGLLLNSATISNLSVYFMHFTLRYITSGLMLAFLPFGLVLRSLSFTRPLGSTLIAIVLSLYFFYPFMLMLNSIIFPAVAGSPPDLSPYTPEASLGGMDRIFSPGNGPELRTMVQWAAYSFFGAIFLPAINFLVIVALARESGRILGEEIDISRLSQMV